MLASVEFGALCVYAPKGTTEVSRKAINLTNRIKNADSEILKSAADGVARRAPEEYPDFFGADTTLVPAPRSHPLMAGQLWPGNRIAHAFLKANLGGNVVPLLRRISPVTKAATAIATERPTVQQHLDSIVVDGELAAPGKIIIVDDVITAGRMMFACASLLQDVYPNAEVRAFAVVRTMSGYVEVDPIVQPVVGTITLLGNGNTTRRP